ncbi:MAG: gamma-glutamyltransferase, partial [Opitutus sp.]
MKRIPLWIACALVQLPSSAEAQRVAVEAKNGMVASVHVLASEAGVTIMRQGGNAVDAAVATGLALSVVYPFAGNISGGGFMIIHTRDGRDVAIDFRETAPAAATRDMYVGSDGKLKNGPGSSIEGWKASGVPGTIAGFALAVKRYGSGKVSWVEICEPARRLAVDGHAVSQGTAASFKTWAEWLSREAESKRIFLKDGAYWQAGDTFVHRDLGATFARMQQQGPREFYEGETAHRIADAMAAHGGVITLEDLKNYRAKERQVLRGQYRGYEIVTTPPPSSGGIALLQMLGMLETTDIRSLGQDSAAKYHLFVEVMKRAFRDRAEYGADPEFVRIPLTELLAPAYVHHRIADFSEDHATPSDRIAPGLGTFVVRPPAESSETTHISTADGQGNVVSTTYTLNGAYGSGVTIPGTGILMNNQMDDFTTQLGASNLYGLQQGEANSIAPGKRPTSSMTPTIVLKDGTFVLATGSP